MTEPKWYPFFRKNNNKALEDNEKVKKHNFVVAKKTPHYVFAKFESIPEFIKYYKIQPKEALTFYEGIRDGIPQKIFFDIDIELKDIDGGIEMMNIVAKNTITEIVKKIFIVFEDFHGANVKPEDILLFTSHGKEKRSFHIVFKNLAVPTYKHNRYIFNEVTRDMQNKKFIDNSVYSTFRLFRMWKSTKFGQDRPKELMKKWKFKDVQVNAECTFEDSLVTYTKKCKILNFDLPEKETQTSFSKTEMFEEKEIEEVLSHIKKDYFEFKGIRNRVFEFRRLKPTKCKVCNRTHDNENPFVMVSDIGEILFFCRRRVKAQRIGMLSTYIEQEDKQANTISKEDLRKFLM